MSFESEADALATDCYRLIGTIRRRRQCLKLLQVAKKGLLIVAAYKTNRTGLRVEG